MTSYFKRLGHWKLFLAEILSAHSTSCLGTIPMFLVVILTWRMSCMIPFASACALNDMYWTDNLTSIWKKKNMWEKKLYAVGNELHCIHVHVYGTNVLYGKLSRPKLFQGNLRVLQSILQYQISRALWSFFFLTLQN